MCVQVVRALLKVGFFLFWYTLKSWPLHFNFWACEALTNLQQLVLRHLRLKAVSALSNKCFLPWWQLDLGGNVLESLAKQFAGEGWEILDCSSFFVSRFFVSRLICIWLDWFDCSSFTPNTFDRSFCSRTADCKGAGGSFGRVLATV